MTAIRADESVFSGDHTALIDKYCAENRYVGSLAGVRFAESFRSRSPLLVDHPGAFSPAQLGAAIPSVSLLFSARSPRLGCGFPERGFSSRISRRGRSKRASKCRLAMRCSSERVDGRAGRSSDHGMRPSRTLGSTLP